MPEDRIVVISSLFPSAVAPLAGLFIRERMFRVGKYLPIIIISPQSWSPFDRAIRRWRPGFRPNAERFELIDGIEVYRPKFFSLPGIGKRFDGWAMSKAIKRQLRLLRGRVRPVLIDGHFLYPDSYAGSLVAESLGIPLTVTIRGSKDQTLIGTSREFGLRLALARARLVISVSDTLKNSVALPMGADNEKIVVLGNGINTDLFFPEDRLAARERLQLPADVKILVTVGALTQLKGFHRVLQVLPGLIERWPNLIYLIVGGRAGHNDMYASLQNSVAKLGLEKNVRFCGPQLPEELRWYYSAADLFVLATEYEGWANVLLEAMACGIPVVTTEVGGNPQVVASTDFGILCPFWDAESFAQAIEDALRREWDLGSLVNYARSNSWDVKIPSLVKLLRSAASM